MQDTPLSESEAKQLHAFLTSTDACVCRTADQIHYDEHDLVIDTLMVKGFVWYDERDNYYDVTQPGIVALAALHGLNLEHGAGIQAMAKGIVSGS